MYIGYWTLNKYYYYYACPVWERSAHAHKVDPVLNDACRAITGCLQPTNVENLYLLAGIAPPAVRRSVTVQREREKQVNDSRHPLHGHNLPRKRLKSRNSFIHATDELIQSPSTRRLEQWFQHLQPVPHRLPQTPSECLASGASGTWTEWRCMNRLHTKMGLCKHNLRKWKYTDEDDTTCDCKKADQTMEHLPECPLLRQTCSLDDLLLLLFAMIRSVVKSFKVPDVEVAAARMSNESALTRMTDSTPKKLGQT